MLTGPDGNPVTDVYGDPVPPTTTDVNGKYSFDDLPALPPGQSYTVTVDVPNSPIVTTLDLVPTNPGNRGNDTDVSKDYSHTNSATSGDLTEDGDHDPTLDFGFRKAKVSVGDYVWLDVNRDGLQDGSDITIGGVVLVLTGPDGNAVTDVFGNPVTPATTDAEGHYLFSNLPTLPAGQSYTVTIDEEKSAEALKGLIPTTPGAGTDGSKDSSTSTASSEANLSTDGSQDLTLDFGFVRPRVSVGDYVWLDTDKDGVQDGNEPGIPGVVLVLTGPDGNPVTDVDGNPVAPVTTDADGGYEFTNLPVLPAGESYTVTIDTDASSSALSGLVPTKPGAGDRGIDSSTGSATSGDLVNDGDHDPTLDFGFIRADITVKTKATKNVAAKVRNDGTMKPVKLTDTVTIKGLAGRADGVARLYGPTAKRNAIMCKPGNLVGTVTFNAKNGKQTTPSIEVTEPGVYTWVVDVEGRNGQTGGHACGLKSETTTVHREAYSPVKIETGATPDVAAKVGALASLGASAIGLKNAPVRPVGIRKGQMVIPEDARTIGWLNRSAAFGDAIGTTAVAAHVSDNSDRPMAFWKLKQLKKGKVVTVKKGGKTHRYKVTAHHKYSRDHGKGIPKKFFKTKGKHRLVLVTCTDKVTTPGGGFHYTNNLVVVAKKIK